MAFPAVAVLLLPVEQLRQAAQLRQQRLALPPQLALLPRVARRLAAVDVAVALLPQSFCIAQSS
jgi:hypothetical protein